MRDIIYVRGFWQETNLSTLASRRMLPDRGTREILGNGRAKVSSFKIQRLADAVSVSQRKSIRPSPTCLFPT